MWCVQVENWVWPVLQWEWLSAGVTHFLARMNPVLVLVTSGDQKRLCSCGGWNRCLRDNLFQSFFTFLPICTVTNDFCCSIYCIDAHYRSSLILLLNDTLK